MQQPALFVDIELGDELEEIGVQPPGEIVFQMVTKQHRQQQRGGRKREYDPDRRAQKQAPL